MVVSGVGCLWVWGLVVDVVCIGLVMAECVCVCKWTKEKGLSCQFPSGSARDTVYSWVKTRLFTANIQWCTDGMEKSPSIDGIWSL